MEDFLGFLGFFLGIALVVSVLLFPFFFIISLSQYVLHWKVIHDTYYRPLPIQGKTFANIRIAVNGVAIGGSFQVEYDPVGIIIQPTFPQRMFMKKVYLSWQELTTVREQTVITFKYRRLTFGKKQSITILDIPNSRYLEMVQGVELPNVI